MMNMIQQASRHDAPKRRLLSQDNITYLILWGLIFASPLLSLYVRAVGNPDVAFDWAGLLVVWRKFAIYFMLFLLHNFVLIPLFLDKPSVKAVAPDGSAGQTVLAYGRRHLTYISIMVAIIVLFSVYQCSTRPELPPAPQGFPPPPPPIVGEHDIMAVIMLILMFGANIGIKWYFRSLEDRRRMSELEKNNLEQQLEFLKYQLNPHFLMNTLNNIHALIDIEPPKAQEAIIHLSKILRYVLYDSNRPRVLMSQEVEFMDNYVQLMRMRYTDKLHFSVAKPDAGTDVYVPPMIFISFVENAFKHGVSYQEDSFISVVNERYTDANGKQRLRWTCNNSKHRQQDSTPLPRQGGVGLVNVRQRLSMIFNDDFTLDVSETANTYNVMMDIPLATTPDLG